MADVYQIVTERVIKLVEEKGHLPWQRPWRVTDLQPCNIERPNKPYRGINFWMTLCQDFKSPFWMTKNTIRKGKGWIKKGEKGTIIVYWKLLEGKDSEGEPNGKRVPFLRYSMVWNLEQVDHYQGKVPELEEVKPLDFNPIDACEMILDEMPIPRTIIEHTGNRACYIPYFDKIKMPVKEDFKGVEEYYATLFHELAHATGHETRVHRKDAFGAGFGKDLYSKEELVAEMTTCYLTHMAGIETTINNSAAYLGSWLKRLKSDPKMLVMAASQAQKAADYILDN